MNQNQRGERERKVKRSIKNKTMKGKEGGKQGRECSAVAERMRREDQGRGRETGDEPATEQ